MKTSYLNILLALALLSCRESEGKKEEPPSEPPYLEVAAPAIPENAVRFSIFESHFYVEAVIQDSIPATLILDTGSGNGLDLDSAFVRKNGLIASEYYNADLKTRAGRVQWIRGLNSLSGRTVPFRLNNILDSLSDTNAWDVQRLLTHSKADGVLGMIFMENFVMEINYEKGYFVFHKPDGFKPPTNTEAVPIDYDNGGLFMEVEYHVSDDYILKEKTRIDIGYGPQDIGFCSYAARRLNLLEHVKEKIPAASWVGSQSGEVASSFTGRIKSLSMGRFGS